MLSDKTRGLRAALLACILALAPLAGAAQGTSVSFGAQDHNPDAPVEISAESLSINRDDNTAVYSGDVLIQQDSMRLAAPQVLVIFTPDNSAIDRMEATGGVTLVSGEDAAEADRAIYRVETGVIEMAGAVLLSQGPNALAAEDMRIDLDGGNAALSGRVRTVLTPGRD